MIRTLTAAATALSVLASPAMALIEVQFGDSAWDVFVITVTDCPVADAVVVIDLVPSVAGVIVDTTYGGPGFQDPLPAELFQGNAILSPVADGAQRLEVTITLLDRDTPIGLRMDVDDTLGRVDESRISVTTSEIAGATVAVTVAGETTTGTFDAAGFATLPLPPTVPDCHLLS